MCGIAGIFNYRADIVPIKKEELRKIRDYQFARGPDAEGEWHSNGNLLGLAHRRLSIIDLGSEANQPMISSNGRYVIVFNGEIYNYQELRKQLVEEGRVFKTKSDTEVLIQSYAHWGEKMFAHLRGMYAFAIWDNDKQRLLLARDPYGIKPLYFSDDGGTLRFASQVKAILAGGRVSKEPDPAGLAGFLLMGSVPEPYTVYRAIRSIPAGHYVFVGKGGMGDSCQHFSIQDVWRNAAAQPISNSTAPLQEIVSDSMRDTVRHHLVADVPVGAFLSAGIDSGAIVGLMQEVSAAKVQGITLGFREFQGKHQDETPLAAEIANHYNCTHEVHWIEDEQVEKDLPSILAAMDQPSVDGVNTWLVSKAAHAAGLKVVLSGVGGDELFGGYSHFKQLPIWSDRYQQMRRIPGLVGVAKRFSRLAAHWHLIHSKALGLIKYGDSYPGLYLVKRGLFMPWELPSLIGEEFAWKGLDEIKPPEFINSMLGPEPSRPFATIAALEAIFYLRNQLLRDSDWASMAHSLELRTPLVDAHLLMKIAPVLVNRPEGIHVKLPLANAPQRALPPQVITRQKTGFSLPMARWIENTGVLDSWRRRPELTKDSCHWSRRMAYSLANELVS